MIPVAAAQGTRSISYGDKEAGLWLKANTPTDAKVMARELSVAAYADRRWVAPPNAEWARFLKYARAHNANYVILRNLLQEFPYLAPTLGNGTPELELMFSFEEPNQKKPAKTLVFRILSPE